MNNEALQYPGRKFDNIWLLHLIFGRVIRQLEVIEIVRNPGYARPSAPR